MATFKVVISDPKSRKAYQKEADHAASGLLGKKVGEKVSGGAFGLEGYSLEVTGGSDKEGFPMRADVQGPARKRIILSNPPGFHPLRKGQRKRKSVRGNTVSPDIVQVNAKVVEYGKKALEEILGVKEKPKEEKKEAKEAKPEEKAEPKKEKPAEPQEQKERPKEAEDQAEKAEKKMGVKKLEG